MGGPLDPAGLRGDAALTATKVCMHGTDTQQPCGPKVLGLDGLVKNEGVRIRAEIATTGKFDTVRPMLGVIGHF